MGETKILLILKSDYTPSARIRFLDLLPFLDAKGIGYEVEYLPTSGGERRRLFKKGAGFDAVVLQKRLPSLWDFKTLRRNARKLAFDFDDAVHLKNASPSPEEKDYASATRARRFKRIVSSADLVIAANRVLADAAAEAAAGGADIEVLPSSVDISPYDPPGAVHRLSDPPVVGWVGTRVAAAHLLHFAPALKMVKEKVDFTLRIVSNEKFDIPGLRVENVEWTLDGEPREIAKFDVGIMPLSDDPFSRGKSSYKLLQYMAAGVPALASAVGMNVEVAGEDENNALLAETPDEFAAKLAGLLENAESRRTLALNGRRAVEQKYARPVIGERFAEIMQRLSKG